MVKRRLLLLGGTRDARQIARALADRPDVDVIYSLAGRTKAPRLPDARIRVGGFGGTDGLATYLKDESIDRVVDATHPFAAQMSRQAVAACESAGVPLLRFDRPVWREEEGDDWYHVPDAAEAAHRAAELGRRVLLTTGRQILHPFLRHTSCWWLVRVVEPSADLPTLENGEYLFSKGPFDLAAERDLLIGHKIDLIVCKNSGGGATAAKLVAARELGLPVVMIDRPSLPNAATASKLEDAIDWLQP